VIRTIQGLTAVLGRVMLCTIFFMAAVGSKIPHFNDVAKLMESRGIPSAKLMLCGAIAFLIVGSISIIVGFQARLGAVLLLIFLALASYYFHNFWALPDAHAQQEQMVQFMKNLSMMGAMVFLIANGSGPMSLDTVFPHRKGATS